MSKHRVIIDMIFYAVIIFYRMPIAFSMPSYNSVPFIANNKQRQFATKQNDATKTCVVCLIHVRPKLVKIEIDELRSLQALKWCNLIWEGMLPPLKPYNLNHLNRSRTLTFKYALRIEMPIEELNIPAETQERMCTHSTQVGIFWHDPRARLLFDLRLLKLNMSPIEAACLHFSPTTFM